MLGFTRSYLGQVWDRLQSSFWFMPLMAAVIAVLLARLLIEIDSRLTVNGTFGAFLQLYSSADHLRSSMVTLAGTTLTTTGIVFTLLTLPLSVVASQFGSRLLRVYLRDRTTQIVLSIFTMTFVYCVAIAVLLPSSQGDEPYASVSAIVALLLAVLSFASLILLIHHVGVSLQAPSVIASASRELQRAVQAAVDASNREEKIGDEQITQTMEMKVRKEGKPIYSRALGYVQFVDRERLLPLTASRDVVLRMECRPGDFVEAGDLLAYAWPADKVTDLYSRRVQSCLVVGNNRIPNQDLRYAVNQLTEVAERALSSAINDPYTAMTVIDHQSAALGLYGGKVRDHYAAYDGHDRLRLIVPPTNFSELIELAFTMPRQALGNNTTLYLRMLRAFEEIGARTGYLERLAPLLEQIELLKAQVERSSIPPQEVRPIVQECNRVSDLLASRVRAETS